ncbi:MAG: hypothetical protein LUE97_01445 [Oscillospiraceae bacterium]|nr:hypothetical protein [Oscillospiraceae bacterium]
MDKINKVKLIVLLSALPTLLLTACAGDNGFASTDSSALTEYTDTVVSCMDGVYSIVCFDMEAGSYAAGCESFALTGGEELCYAYTMNLDAQLGLLDTETGSLYTVALARAFSEGSTGEKTLKLSDENIPAGVYDVVVVCPAGAGYAISAAVNFEWKQSQDTA